MDLFRFMMFEEDGAPAGSDPAPEAPKLAGWMNSFSTEVREKHGELLSEYAEKTPDDLLSELSTFKRQAARTIVVPDPQTATDEDRKAFMKQMGIPETPDGYGKVEGVPETAAKQLSAKFHELGMTEAQGKGALELIADVVKQGEEAQTAAQEGLEKTFPDRMLAAVGGDAKKAEETINLAKAQLASIGAKLGEHGESLLKDFEAMGLGTNEKFMLFLAQSAREAAPPRLVQGEGGPVSAEKLGKFGGNYHTDFVKMSQGAGA